MNTSLEQKLLTIDGWKHNQAENCLEKCFDFKSYLKNIAFVNAIAWLANKENHHPDLTVTFNKCIVKLTTHDVNGLSDKDFAMAGKINGLFN